MDSAKRIGTLIFILYYIHKLKNFPTSECDEFKYYMNWMPNLAPIKCNNIYGEAIEEDIDIYGDQTLDHRVVLDVSDIESTWDEFNCVGTSNCNWEIYLFGFPKHEAKWKKRMKKSMTYYG